MNDEGDRRSYSVQIRIRRRLAGTTAWQLVETLDIRASQTEAFFRQHKWDFPTRGRWEIELTRMNADSTNASVSDRAVWAALQTYRPEYPLNFEHPLCLVALRIKATHQINGSLDNFSALAERVCRDYDHTTGNWVMRSTSNPASLYRHALQSPANPRPVANSAIDLEQLEDWHDFCRIRGLTYSRVMDDAGTTLIDALREITLAGRATPRHDGLKWGVTIDRPQDLIVDHISPRNAWNIRTSRSYVRNPDGIRVKFQDETNDYADAEWLIPWLGHSGPVELTELLEMPGKTNPDEICREVYRRMLEVKYRPDGYEAMQDGDVLVLTRGDLATLTSDIIDSAQQAGVVTAVIGNSVHVDALFEVEPGENYGIQFRVFDGAADQIGRAVVRTVDVVTHDFSTELRLTGAGDAPAAGDMVLFGRAGSETRPVIVTGVEVTQDTASLIRMIDAAPEIDAELATLPLLPWTGRVGFVADTSGQVPGAPVWTSIKTGMAAYSDFMTVYFGELPSQRSIVYALKPGAGSVPALSFRIEHRRVGAASWNIISTPAANAGGNITTYTLGDAVELRAAAVSGAGMSGPYGPTVSVVIGDADAKIPDDRSVDGVEVEVVPGGVRIVAEIAADSSATQVQLYRSTSDTLNRSANKSGVPVAVQPGREVRLFAGDLTRKNLIGSAGAFDNAAAWTAGAGWSIVGGKATHAPTSAGRITRTTDIRPGLTYRVSYTATVAAGGAGANVRAELAGGPLVTPGDYQGTSGRYTDRLTAASDDSAVSIYAQEAFDGTVDDVVIYAETAGCLPVGTNYFWIEPINADGIAGAVIGPFTASIE